MDSQVTGHIDGQRLRAIRRELGWTQRELADEAGVTANTVARWERGERPIPRMLVSLLRLIRPNSR
jgi:transcriptional regulator with XRE-family HTH domain